MSIIPRENPFRAAGYALAQSRAPGLARAMARRFTQYRNRFFENNRGSSGRRVLSRQRAARASYVRSSRNRRGRSGIGVTTQNDQRLVYRKKRMPFGRKRRWKAFTKKVNFINEKDMGTRTVVMNTSFAATNTSAGNHIVGAVYLYPQQSAGATYANDLTVISNLENANDPTAAAGQTVDASSRFFFQSGVLDVTFCNTSTYSDIALNPQRDSRAKLEVDVYECSVRESTEETGATYGSFTALLANNLVRTRAIGGAGNEIDYQLRGCTPFDLSYVLSRWGVKIWKKTKYFVNNSDTFTYQVRDPRRHVVDQRNLQGKDGFNRPGWTRVIYFVGKLVPGLSVAPTAQPQSFQEALTVGITRKYMYKIEGLSEDRTSYIQG